MRGGDDAAQKIDILIKAINGLTFLVYPSTSTSVFTTFNCRTFDAGDEPSYRRLAADLSIDCDGERHRMFVLYAYVMMLVWPIGIPAYMCLVFYQNRNAALGAALWL